MIFPLPPHLITAFDLFSNACLQDIKEDFRYNPDLLPEDIERRIANIAREYVDRHDPLILHAIAFDTQKSYLRQTCAQKEAEITSNIGAYFVDYFDSNIRKASVFTHLTKRATEMVVKNLRE